MVRQAHNYLVGAMSGTAMIGVAVVAFIMLVSLQALRDWPLAALGGSDPGTSAVAPAQHAAAGSASPVGEGGAANGPGSTGGTVHNGGNSSGDGGSVSPSEEPAGLRLPAATIRGEGGGGRPAEAGQNESGQVTATPGSSAGAASSGSGESGSGGHSGGGSGSAGSGSGGPSPSETVAGAVGQTVAGVDGATGGALSGTGVTKTTEEVVSGAAGPESPVGETIDKTVEKVGETVGGLLGH